MESVITNVEDLNGVTNEKSVRCLYGRRRIPWLVCAITL